MTDPQPDPVTSEQKPSMKAFRSALDAGDVVNAISNLAPFGWATARRDDNPVASRYVFGVETGHLAGRRGYGPTLLDAVRDAVKNFNPARRGAK